LYVGNVTCLHKTNIEKLESKSIFKLNFRTNQIKIKGNA